MSLPPISGIFVHTRPSHVTYEGVFIRVPRFPYVRSSRRYTCQSLPEWLFRTVETPQSDEVRTDWNTNPQRLPDVFVEDERPRRGVELKTTVTLPLKIVFLPVFPCWSPYTVGTTGNKTHESALVETSRTNNLVYGMKVTSNIKI